MLAVAGSTTASSEAVESSIEASGASASSSAETKTEGDNVQLEPTESEMERERLMSRAEQVSDLKKL